MKRLSRQGSPCTCDMDTHRVITATAASPPTSPTRSLIPETSDLVQTKALPYLDGEGGGLRRSWEGGSQGTGPSVLLLLLSVSWESPVQAQNNSFMVLGSA